MQVVFYQVHWAGCMFYYIAKQSGFTNSTWVGASQSWVASNGQPWPPSMWEAYVYSSYWSIVTFATVGYGDFHAYK